MHVQTLSLDGAQTWPQHEVPLTASAIPRGQGIPTLRVTSRHRRDGTRCLRHASIPLPNLRRVPAASGPQTSWAASALLHPCSALPLSQRRPTTLFTSPSGRLRLGNTSAGPSPRVLEYRASGCAFMLSSPSHPSSSRPSPISLVVAQGNVRLGVEALSLALKCGSRADEGGVHVTLRSRSFLLQDLRPSSSASST